MKELIKIPVKELREMEIANLSDGEFKTLVIRMLRELNEYGKWIREEMKATLSEIKKNPQRTNSKEKEVRIQIKNLRQKEEMNIQQEQKEKTRSQTKPKDSVRRPWDISRRVNIQIIRVQKGEETEQEIENLFEKTMKENFPNLAKEIDI